MRGSLSLSNRGRGGRWARLLHSSKAYFVTNATFPNWKKMSSLRRRNRKDSDDEDEPLLPPPPVSDLTRRWTRRIECLLWIAVAAGFAHWTRFLQNLQNLAQGYMHID